MDKRGDRQLCGCSKGLGLGNQDYSTGMLMLSREGGSHLDGTNEAAGHRRRENENRELEASWLSGNDKHCSR
eukprot:1085385-Heterocapsa_arctica.AAC.1